MNPPRGMYPPRVMVAGFISSLPVTRPLVLPADVSIVFGSGVICCGIHPLGHEVVTPPQCALNRAFMWI